jgi:hypothetical protein
LLLFGKKNLQKNLKNNEKTLKNLKKSRNKTLKP